MKNKILITIGPIPGRLDSVKIITNKFKGKLGQKTIEDIISHYLGRFGAVPEITVVCHERTELDPRIEHRMKKVIRVKDVHDYVEKVLEYPQQDMYVLSAAVANLVPEKVIEGKFPSHNYKEGDVIQIPFVIAPRLVDRIKKKFPTSTLIAYKLYDGTHDELIKAARLLQRESKADLVFANSTKDLSTKFCLNKEGAIQKCDWRSHISLMVDALKADYYRTIVGKEEIYDINKVSKFVQPWMKLGIATDENGEKHGSFAWCFGEKTFITTGRGHENEYSIVTDVFHDKQIVMAEQNKPCPLAPVYWAIFTTISDCLFIVHTHKRISNPHIIIPYTPTGTRQLTTVVIKEILKYQSINQAPGKELIIKIENHGSLIIFPFYNENDVLYAENKMKLFSITGDWNV